MLFSFDTRNKRNDLCQMFGVKDLIVLCFLLLCVKNYVVHGSRNYSSVEAFFLVELKDGTVEDAIQLAQDNHYKLIKQISGFPNVFLFEKLLISSGNEKRSDSGKYKLESDDRVLWASQQTRLRRDKRDFIIKPYEDYFDYSAPRIEEYKDPYRPVFNDELWSKQWYMQKSLNRTGRKNLDLNVLPVYARDITGRGVRVAVLDDGLEYDHEDLIENYDPEISWDCNNDVPDPHPNYKDLSNRHGTRCAGEIAMVANNKKCGVGVAFNSRIGGIKLLAGDVYDLIEGMALGFAHDKVDIYSSSWGPTDNGRTLEKPGIFASKALERGINKGRNGLGSIFVWASGNGRARDDNCNCDGYAASIYTITIGSVTQQGDVPWYSERCPSILAVTYSSGALDDQMIATTDLGNACTVKHTGTSASAPLAAGIIALGLEANPDLTWRDVQHIIIKTSEYTPVKFNTGWQRNGAGLFYSTGLGFGLMNADGFVSAAVRWETVPEKIVDKIQGYTNTSPNERLETPSKHFTNRTKVFFEYWDNRIRFLEHVQISVNIGARRRGNLEIFLKSPSGMRVPILEKRARDNSKEGFVDWTFMSVATWSENPKGQWEMEIVDNTPKIGYILVGNCHLILHGTEASPFIR